MKKIFMLFTLLLIAGSLAMSQTVQITGTVTSSEDGIAIPGVTVSVKGTTMGVTTGFDGKFTLNVSANNTLIFSFIGMKTQEIPVAGKTVFNVALESDVTNLNEVVVIGYGTAKRVGTVVGSLTQVSAAKIAEKPTANVLDALQGKVAGLQVYTSSGEPSQLSTIRLHGVGSLGASSTPLYVLDGNAIDASTMLALNSNDFESVTVLKDASATSIYGTRAANGVIYITTKHGNTDTKAKIRLNSQWGSSTIANKDFFNSFMNTKELTDFWITTGYQTQAQVDATLKAYPFDTKWFNTYYKPSAPTYQTDLSISGGGGKTTYFLSGSYFFADGLAYRSAFDRYSLRSNINTKANDWLSVGLNITASTDKRQTNPYGSNSTNRGLAMLRQPFYSPVDTLGVKYPDLMPGVNAYNPEYLAEKIRSLTKNSQLNGMAYVQLTPVKGLTIRAQGGMDAYDQVVSAKQMPSYKGSLNVGNASETFYRGVTLNTTNTAEYKFSVGDRHNFTVLAGQEGYRNISTNFYAYVGGLSDDRLMLLGAGTSATRNVSSAQSEYAYLSYFGRLDYSLDEKYFIDFSIRRDGSSRFGIEKRYANFFSTGIMWNAKKEAFLENLQFLSSLNVKASIGTSGNSDISNYASLSTFGTNLYNGGSGFSVGGPSSLGGPGNPELSWENQLLTTVGVKFGFLEDRYRFNIEYYNRTTSNMLVDVPYPYTSGFNAITTNVGSLKNSGFDISIDFDIVKGSDFYVTPWVTLNYNKNEVTKLFNGLNFWSIPNTGVCWIVGQPVSFFYPYFAGIDPADGSPTWYVPGTDPTKVSKETTTKTFASPGLNQSLGKPRFSPFTGGFGLNTGWKGIAIQADFAFAYKKYLFNNDRYFFENPTQAGFAGYNQSKRVLNYWKQPGDNAEFPAYNASTLWTQFDSRLIEDASFMRLKNLTISYSIPASVLKSTKFFSSARIFATGRNLLTFTKYLGPDPEVDSNLTLGANPNTKQFSFGADISF
jgi:TonB-linked SusC/RagA family outer membrane protein